MIFWEDLKWTKKECNSEKKILDKKSSLFCKGCGEGEKRKNLDRAESGSDEEKTSVFGPTRGHDQIGHRQQEVQAQEDAR